MLEPPLKKSLGRKRAFIKNYATDPSQLVRAGDSCYWFDCETSNAWSDIAQTNPITWGADDCGSLENLSGQTDFFATASLYRPYTGIDLAGKKYIRFAGQYDRRNLANSIDMPNPSTYIMAYDISAPWPYHSRYDLIGADPANRIMLRTSSQQWEFEYGHSELTPSGEYFDILGSKKVISIRFNGANSQVKTGLDVWKNKPCVPQVGFGLSNGGLWFSDRSFERVHAMFAIDRILDDVDHDMVVAQLTANMA